MDVLPRDMHPKAGHRVKSIDTSYGINYFLELSNSTLVQFLLLLELLQIFWSHLDRASPFIEVASIVDRTVRSSIKHVL